MQDSWNRVRNRYYMILIVDGGLISELLNMGGLVHAHSEILCGPALPGHFVHRKTTLFKPDIINYEI